MRPGIARALLAAVLVAHAAVAWFPFRLDVPGHVRVEVEREDSGALTLGGRRIVAVGTPPWGAGDLASVELVSVVLEVRPARPFQHGPARILTISDGYSEANLMIGQQRDNLVVRVRREASDAAGNPPLVLHRAFASGEWVRIHVVVTDGRVVAAVEHLPNVGIDVDGVPMRTWDPSYRVYLGDERPGGRVWHGQVRRAVVTADDRTVDYLDPAALDVPERAWYMPQRLLDSLEWPDARARLRSLAHLLAFVPVGALLVAARRTSHSLPALAAVGLSAAGISLVLQGVKIVLDARHPSLLTVLTQTLGALAGAWLLLRFGRRRGGR